MPKTPKFNPIPTASGWMVSLPPNMTGAGKRERRFFTDEREALKLAKRLRAEYQVGNRGGLIDAGLARMAADAAKILEPWGVSILDAAREIAKQYAANRAASGADETFGERYQRFTAANENRWSGRYRSDMEKIPRWVGGDFMATPCALIVGSVIESALRANGAASPSTVKARRARVVAVVAAKGKGERSGPPEIMTVRECAAMVRACRSAPERWAVALLLFAGVRPDGELGRLDWSDVGRDHITIHPETSKTGTDRHIPIKPRLARLLRGRPADGPVIPPNWQRRIKTIRKDAGISGKQDITRHTFASHYLAAFGESATPHAMGHTEGSTTLFRHYLRAVLDHAGQRYFR